MTRFEEKGIKLIKSRIFSVKECTHLLFLDGTTYLSILLCDLVGQPASLDKAPRPSISNVYWISSSDTICQLSQLFSNSEAAMLSTRPFKGSPKRLQTIFCLRISENESTGVQYTSAEFCMAGKK